MKIQSISDIITNSSSEVFCRIDTENIEEIYEIFDKLFNYNRDTEEGPTIEIRSKVNDEYIDDLNNLKDTYLEIWLPYHLSDYSEFFKAGIETILNNKMPFTISYDV